jgi:hypothetical protein
MGRAVVEKTALPSAIGTTPSAFGPFENVIVPVTWSPPTTDEETVATNRIASPGAIGVGDASRMVVVAAFGPSASIEVEDGNTRQETATTRCKQ